MMEWDREQTELRDAAIVLGQELTHDHLKRDHAGEFPADKWKLVQDSGLLGLPFEGRRGGLDRDLLTTMYVLEGLGFGCRDSGLTFSVSTHIVSTGIPIHQFGSDALKERYLPAVCAGELIGAHAVSEPDAGSDMLAMRTRARPDGDVFVLNGTKAFVTNGPIADLIVVYAVTEPDAGPFGLSAIVVERDTPGLIVGEPLSKMGLRTSPLSEIAFDDCRVPAANVIGGVGAGYSIFDHVIQWEILCSFAVTVGEMRHRLDRTVEYAKSRRQFGRHIGAFQSVANRVVDMRIAVDTSRRALYHAAAKLSAGQDAAAEVAIAKLLTSEGNLATAVAAVQTFGGYGYMAEYGLEHDVRAALAGTIYSGTTDVQRGRIAKLMGL
ncbi:acyl-CoA dehydrogenase family protein [Actinomadura meridiana]|uniref:Acyl-CoA dehydrogenase family protein n=1 Tax=Actinomadura meridiana TaxID=559626 RepID=A0ABP8C265_9ACTN